MQYRLYLITQRSTGHQKQALFLPIGKLSVKERYHFKINSFFAFAACELNVRRYKMKNSNYLKNMNLVLPRAIAVLALIFHLLVLNANQLFAEDYSIPKNAYRIGNTWYCKEGYRKVGNECVKLNVPENAYVSGNAWYCKEGFRRVGNECARLKVPKNAYVSGNAWYCKEGYRRVRNECVKLNVPENAYVSGNAWYCKEGYRRVRNECVRLNVPEDAYVSGNAWYCKEGFRRVGDKCVKLKPGEKIQVIAPSYGYRSFSYSVSGYGDKGYVYGDIDADGSRDVSGYLYLEDGSEVYFDGEWVGKGEIEGYDEDGNYFELEVD